MQTFGSNSALKICALESTNRVSYQDNGKRSDMFCSTIFIARELAELVPRNVAPWIKIVPEQNSTTLGGDYLHQIFKYSTVEYLEVEVQNFNCEVKSKTFFDIALASSSNL